MIAGVRTTGRSRPVDPAAIERELTALWMAEADLRQRQGRDKPLSRTLLHTLVVVARDQAGADQARELVMTLSPREPARTILVQASENDPAGTLEAAVTLQCTAPQNGQEEVCGELVGLEAHGAAAVRRLAGAVLPLLLTDVPSFVWWQTGNPFGHPLLKDLGPAIDRLIVDSFSFSAAKQAVEEISRATADTHSGAIVSDLSWSRLAPWRYRTAHIFDAATIRPYLERLRRVRVRFYAGSPILAWLYGGWMASRLGWVPAGGLGDSLNLTNGAVIDFEAVPVVAEVPPGYFAGAQLMADDGAVFEVSRLSSACTVTHLSIGELQTERVVPLRQESATEWLGHELGRLGPAPTYDAAVRLLAEAL